MEAVVSGAAVDMLGCRCSCSEFRGADAGGCVSVFWVNKWPIPEGEG